ncbi:MAG: FAD-binding oxidoreductase [Candidatus Hodarchaeota archaeon]
MVKADLIPIVGEQNISTDAHVLVSYSEDASPFEGKPPGIVVRPSSTEEISEIMKIVSAKEVPVVPVGGRSSISGSTIPRVDGALMIDFTRMNEILEINEETMTVTVQIGITWSGLIHQLKEKGYKLGFRGPYGGNAGTVGGSLSGNSIGCGASAHGGAADSVVGLEVVLVNGEIIRTGSNWKESSSLSSGAFARYCTFNDITGIFLGDHGSLGMKTAATLKIYPVPNGVAYVDFGFENIDKATKAFHELQSNHAAEELVILGDSNSIELLASSYKDTFKEVNCILAVIIEEINQDIAGLKKEYCEKVARKHGGKSIGTFLSKAHWLNMFNMVQSLFEEGFWYNTCHLRSINSLPGLVDKFHELASKHDLKKNEINWIISALGVRHCFTSGWITLFLKDKSKQEILEKAWHELKSHELDSGGVPYWSGKLWEPYCLPAASDSFLGVMKKIKNALDPKNLIHPGVFNLQK